MKITKLRDHWWSDPILIGSGLAITAFMAAFIWFVSWMSTPTIVQLQEIQKKLPAGCEFLELGEYGRINQVVMVRCKAQDTTTLTTISDQGKHQEQTVVVSIND